MNHRSKDFRLPYDDDVSCQSTTSAVDSTTHPTRGVAGGVRSLTVQLPALLVRRLPTPFFFVLRGRGEGQLLSVDEKL
jgi:hypothetical protein